MISRGEFSVKCIGTIIIVRFLLKGPEIVFHKIPPKVRQDIPILRSALDS